MKQLVSIATILKLIEADQTECCVEERAIVTPAAMDLAEEHGISIIKEKKSNEMIEQSNLLDSLKVLMSNRDFVQNMINNLEEPYRYETDSSDIKLIYGESIQLFSQGSWKKQTLFSNIFGGLTIDFLETSKKTYQHHFEAEEFLLLLEGQATFDMDGKKVIAKKGDCVHFPKNTSTQVSFDEVCKHLTIHPK